MHWLLDTGYATGYATRVRTFRQVVVGITSFVKVRLSTICMAPKAKVLNARETLVHDVSLDP